MTTDQTPPPGDQNEPDDPAGLRKQLKELREQNAALAQKVSTFERADVFDKAGVPKDGPAKWFRNAYDGELTPEAIKAAAEADGLIPKADPPPPPEPTTPPAESSTHTAIDEFVEEAAPPIPAGVMDQMRQVAAEKGPEGLAAFMESQGLAGN